MTVTGMYPRILTELERKRVKAFLAKDGEKTMPIVQLAHRCRRSLKELGSDLTLIEQFLQHYRTHGD